MSPQVRAILHIDLDAFFAAVEVLENPELAGQPVLVGARPEQRGVVAAASYPARAYGIHSAMPMSRALTLCPGAIIVPPRHGLYREYSRKVMSILSQMSDEVEQLSIDEAFLNLTDRVGLWEESVDQARQLQAQVRQEVGLSASIGVATNKQVAKVASDRDKPGGLTVVRPGEEAEFLAPLPVRVLWGIGPVTASRLQAMNVSTVGQLAVRQEAELRAAFGKHGPDMARRARGIDNRRVVAERERKSVSQERTFSRDIGDLQALKRHLWRMSRGVAGYLQRSHRAAGTVSIKLRYGDFTTLTRQMSLSVPTDEEREIYRTALQLLQRTWDPSRPVRLLGVGTHQLTQPTGQLSLFGEDGL